MAFKLNSNIVLSNDGINIPVFAGNARPANPVTGQVIYNSSTNIMEIYDGGLWKDVTQNASGTAFLYRQLISTSYVAGGYQSSSPWKNVNRMSQSTDIMTNLGDLLSIAANYTSGANSLTTAYMWCASPTWDGTAVATVAYNMATETSAGSLSSWNMPVARNDCGTIFKETQYAFVTGGSSADVSVWTFSTESFSTGAVSGMTGGADFQYGVATISDETSGYWWGSGGQKLTFGTGTAYTIANAANVNVNGQQKGISSKLGFGYFGNEGTYNGGYNLRKYITSTDTYTTIPKPVTNSGEENFDMGQYWQYMMGCYDGAQNNRGWKFSYTADTGYELGSGSVRTGVPGGSSGHCAWKA